MSPKQRFYIMLEPAQIENLRRIESATGATASAQIRLAIEVWFEKHAALLEPLAKESRKKK